MRSRTAIALGDVADGTVPRQPLQRRPGRVSVVIPCYNYGRYLRDCVGSVLEQAAVEVRVLIIDDASTDDSARVAAELATADARVELRVHSVNHGHISTYNEGIEWAAAPYTVLLDADDLLAPGSLQRACELLDAHPEVGFVYGRPFVFRDGPPRLPAWTGPGRWGIRPGREWLEQRCRTAENCIRSPEVVMRSSLLRQVGGFRPELPHTADFEMWMRLALHADVGYIAGPHQAYYRDHSASMHRRRFGTELADLAQMQAAFEVIFRDHGPLVPDRQRLEALVRRAFAERALRAACWAYDGGPWEPTEAAGLEELAVTTYGAADTLEDMQRLRWRKHLGYRLWRILLPVLMRADRLAHWLRRHLQRAA